MMPFARITRAIIAVAAIALALAACGGNPDRIGVSSLPVAGGGMDEQVFVVSSRALVDDRNVLFDGNRSSNLHFAAIDVSVPDRRKPGEVTFPKKKLDLSTQFAARSIALTDEEATFSRHLKEELDRWPAGQRKIFIYVHGYNTTFAGGLFRAAQLSHDYGMTGATLNYTWPSAGNAAMYLYDRDSADFARAGLVRTLRLAYAAEPESIVLIAHSMGAAMAMDALRDLSIADAGHIVRLIEALILASPDIDADVFQNQVASLSSRPGAIAVIVSKRDKALRLSKEIRGGETRVGLSDDAARLREQGILVIDASGFKDGEDPSGHHAFANSPAMIKLLRGSGLSISSLADAGRATSGEQGIGREGGALSAIERLKRRVKGGG